MRNLFNRIKLSFRILFGLEINKESKKLLNDLNFAWNDVQMAEWEISHGAVDESVRNHQVRDIAVAKRARIHHRLVQLLDKPWITLQEKPPFDGQ